MTTRKDINSQIETVATEVINDLNAINELKGTVSAIDLIQAIEWNTLDLTFENETSEGLFSTLVKNRISKLSRDLYEVIFPPMAMDVKGNWTTNKLKWV